MPSPVRLREVEIDPPMPIWWDWGVLGLTLLALGQLIGSLFIESDSPLLRYYTVSDNLACAIFAVDFGIRLWRSPRRGAFLRAHWIDLLAAIPLVDSLRAMRVVRVFRIVRVMRVAILIRRLWNRGHAHVPRNTFTYLAVLAAIIWVLSASAFYLLESDSNPAIHGFDDALWWSMATLSTVGYGDIYPRTDAGRVVAIVTMILGVGVLGTVAATVANFLIDARERSRRGLGSYDMQGHLLILNWNEKAPNALEEYRTDARHAEVLAIVVADLDTSPVDDPNVRYVRGKPTQKDALTRASAESAAAAIVLASSPSDPRSDHESALIIHALKRLNPSLRIAAELVDPSNREHLEDAGCTSVVDATTVASGLLARSVQDTGVADVVRELLTNRRGTEIYRATLEASYVGKTYRALCLDMVEARTPVIGLYRENQVIVNPPLDTVILATDEAFLVADKPPVR